MNFTPTSIARLSPLSTLAGLARSNIVLFGVTADEAGESVDPTRWWR